MAEIVLTFALEETLKKVVLLAVGGVQLAWGFKAKLKKLKQSLESIRAVLCDAEDKQAEKPFVKDWLQKIREVAYKVDDVLDEFGYEVLRQKVETTPTKKVCNFFSASNPIAFRLQMAMKIDKINAELAEIKNDAASFGLISVAISTERASHTGPGRVITDSILSKSEQIIGRDNDVSKVIELLNVSRDEMLTIVPIVGMGGLGKTTLAKLVVKAVEEKSLFNKKIWVCVSQDFNIQRILGEMYENLEGRSMMSNLDAIERRLQDNLEGKRFLLVLDDVWNKESNKWESLKDCLSKVSGSNGNVVLVTTRSQETASMMETRPGGRYVLKGLRDEECWSIIRGIVQSRNDKALIFENLEVLGKEIAKKCGGVPLAARMLGGLMGQSMDERHWLSIRDNHVWASMANDDGILPALKLSFDHLPSDLKSCFAYCAMFPEDHDIRRDQLIQLWMAEGLLGTANDKNAGGAKNSLTAVFPKMMIITLEPLVLAWVIAGCKSLYQSMAPGLSCHGGMLVGSLTSSTSTALNHLQESWLFSLTWGTDPRFVKVEPVFRCSSLKCGGMKSIPLTVEWSTSQPHDYLLVGCQDGLVALWKFAMDGTSGDTRPLLCFSAHTVPIRAVAWAPVDSHQESTDVILTAGHAGLKFWDLRSKACDCLQ
ncbi:hypothetical protein Tsubulata_006485 [Turnera subulata]|uniref:NB-ARC domain-containing protein n=1 Tax=Turnera subulata TaxID=218843 RepID=A0A9Q0JK88_9ROSI|nr:hypothetical protein Tsubulata_006485 [Turnera subulata]